jgi:hypothetical protein
MLSTAELKKNWHISFRKQKKKKKKKKENKTTFQKVSSLTSKTSCSMAKKGMPRI